MATVVIIGLIVAVVALIYVVIEEKNAVRKYEQDLLNKAKKRKK